MTAPLQVIPHRSFTIEVLHDQDFNFVRDFGTAGVMVTWHRKYRLGHVQPEGSPEEFLREKIIDWYHTYLTSNRKFDAQVYQEYVWKVEEMSMAELTVEFEKHHVSVPLYLLDHSSQHIKAGSGFGDPWDSGCIGFMYMEQSVVFDHFQLNAERLSKALREKAIARMTLETQDYNTYLQGEVYRYRIMQDGEVWYEGDGGWFGDDGIRELVKEATAQIDRPKCDQCHMSTITTTITVRVHEDGCPNDDKVWNADDQSWHELESTYIDEE